MSDGRFERELLTTTPGPLEGPVANERLPATTNVDPDLHATNGAASTTAGAASSVPSARQLDEESAGAVTHGSSTAVRLIMKAATQQGGATAYCNFSYVTDAP